MPATMFSFLLLLLLPSLATALSPASPSNGTTVYDLLPEYGLPPGILPDTVKSFSLASDGRFVVELYGDCYVDFEYLVYYYPRVSGTVKYGAIEDLEGVQVRRFFVWLNVDGIRVDPSDPDSIVFVVGWITRKLRIDQFETVHSCRGNLSVLRWAKEAAWSVLQPEGLMMEERMLGISCIYVVYGIILYYCSSPLWDYYASILHDLPTSLLVQ